MARNQDKFQEWLQTNEIPLKIQNSLVRKCYDNMDTILCLSNDDIDNLFRDLNSKEKNILKVAINGTVENEVRHRVSDSNHSDESELDYEIVRWREFGMARPHVPWKRDFYPVEIFSPDGYWAWNAASKSQIFDTKKRAADIWNEFENNTPGWLLGPPVLLPSNMKSYKLTFSLRVKPNDEDDYPMLQILLVNDKYNKRIYKEDESLSFHMSITFVNVNDGKQVGEAIEADIVFSELHESFSIKLPGRILNLKKPPIIICNVCQ